MENTNQNTPMQEYQPQMNTPPSQALPPVQLKPRYGLAKFLIFGFLTFGIYMIYLQSKVGEDLNTIAGRYDGKHTMHYCLLAFLLMPLTCGLAMFVWFHRISSRIGKELARRGISYSFSALSFWGWCVLGAITIICPFVYYHKMFKAMNLLVEDYNVNG